MWQLNCLYVIVWKGWEKLVFYLNISLQVAEKIVLPSAEDLKQEKTHENLQKGIEGFTPDKLKSVKTKEPATGAERKKYYVIFYKHTQ